MGAPKIILDRKRNNKSALLVIVSIAAVGTLVVALAKASTSVTSMEAENGTISGNACSVADSSASAGQTLKFGCSTLDATGSTIPDTDYAIPGGAIFMATTGSDSNAGTQSAPVATLAHAISLVPSGGTIVVRAGTYRDGSSASVTKNFTLQPYPHEQVWFDGTNLLTGWTNDGNGQWSIAWSTPSFCNGSYYTDPYNAQTTTGPCAYSDEYGDPANPAAGDPQMVFDNGTYVHEVTSLGAATGQNFYYDETNQELYIGFDPTSQTVEVTARPMAIAFQGGAGGDIVQGIGFKRFASNEYAGNITDGAVNVNEPNITLENDVFTLNAGDGLAVSDPTGVVIQSDVFANNGANGIIGNGHEHSTGVTDDLDIENNIFNGNNSEHFGTGCSASCSAGNIKLSHMDGFTLKNNILENAVGNAKGFWCDLDCSSGVMVDNLVANNDNTGLMYEVSNTGIIASNLIYGNGYGDPSDANAGSGGFGLKMGSANTEIYNNTLVNNSSNALIYDDNRSPTVGGDIGPDTTNVDFSNNVLSGGSSFEVEAQRTSSSGTNTGPDTFFSGFDYNSYYRPSGSPSTLVDWVDGTTTPYTSTAALDTAQGWESHGQDSTTGSDPFFVNAASQNYAIRSTSVAYGAGKTLPADVAAALGLSTSQTVSRGAISWPSSN